MQIQVWLKPNITFTTERALALGNGRYVLSILIPVVAPIQIQGFRAVVVEKRRLTG
jgi:hypothetical protein